MLSVKCLVALVLCAHLVECKPRGRTVDGSGNNVIQTKWGATGSTYKRISSINGFVDGISIPRNGPNPRKISNEVFGSKRFRYNTYDVSTINVAWGQFIAHDMSFVRPLREKDAAVISVPIPTCDQHIDPDCTGTKKMDVVRAQYVNNTFPGQPREFINMASGYIDASTVYGHTFERLHELRLYFGGLLKYDPTNGAPINNEGFQQAGIVDPRLQRLTGDVRGNVNPGLLCLHSLFVLEHNRIAQELSSENPSWTDEKVFQEARKLVVAIMQSITYNEYLPVILGQGLPNYDGYSPLVNPSPSLEFTMAAYRYGHSGINSMYWRVNSDGSPHRFGHLLLRDVYFDPSYLFHGGMAPIFRGMAIQPEKNIEPSLVDDVRHFLEGTRRDLVVYDISRGRDVGLPTYVQMRQILGLTVPQSWSDVTEDVAVQVALKQAYDDDIAELDLLVGGMAEPHVPGGMVGETFAAIIRQQFLDSRAGDRYFYMNRYPDGESHGKYLTDEQMEFVGMSTLSAVIKRNVADVGDNFPSSAFRIAKQYTSQGSTGTSVSDGSTPSGATTSDSGSSGSSSGGGGGRGSRALLISPTVIMRWQPPAESEDDITLNFEFSGTGWFAVGIGNGMSDADIIIMKVEGGNARATDTYSSGYVTPGADPSQDVSVVSGKEEGGKTFVSIRRKLDTGDSSDKPFVRGSNTAMMVAWDTGSDAVANHGSDRNRLSVDMFRAPTASENGTLASAEFDNTVDDARLAEYRFHGISMFSIWGVLVPIGSFTARFMKHSSVWLNFHKWSMMMAATITIPAAGAALASTGTENENRLRHAWIGLTLALVMLGQMIVGAIVRHWLRGDGKPPVRSFWVMKWTHRLVGWILTTLGAVNVRIGAGMLVPDLQVWVDVYLGLLLFVAICLTLFRQLKGNVLSLGLKTSEMEQTNSKNLVNAAHALSIADVRQHIRGGCKWVILGGRVYDVAAYMKNHPGGAYLIERCLGQDISSYFFGRECPGDGVPAHVHSVFAHKQLSRCLVGVLRAASGDKSWADDIHLGDESTDIWTLKDKQEILGGDRPIVRFYFDSTHAMGVTPELWKPSSFGRFMQVQVAVGRRGTRRKLSAILPGRKEEIVYDERAYTIVRPQNGRGLYLYIRKYPHGLVSPIVHTLSVGDSVRMRGPQGLGLYVHDNDDGTMVGIAQGTGIFTFFDILQHIVALRKSYGKSVELEDRYNKPIQHCNEDREVYSSTAARKYMITTPDMDEIVQKSKLYKQDYHTEVLFEPQKLSKGGKKRSFAQRRREVQSHAFLQKDANPLADESVDSHISHGSGSGSGSGLEMSDDEKEIAHNNAETSRNVNDNPNAEEDSRTSRKHATATNISKLPPISNSSRRVVPAPEGDHTIDMTPNQSSQQYRRRLSQELPVEMVHQQFTDQSPTIRTDMTTSSSRTRAPGCLKLILMVCVEDESKIPEFDWLLACERECPDFELHINVKKFLNKSVAKRSFPQMTDGYLSPHTLASLIPSSGLLSIAICGSPYFETTIANAYRSMGVPPGLLTSV